MLIKIEYADLQKENPCPQSRPLWPVELQEGRDCNLDDNCPTCQGEGALACESCGGHGCTACQQKGLANKCDRCNGTGIEGAIQ
jgi:hypothetical protein